MVERFFIATPVDSGDLTFTDFEGKERTVKSYTDPITGEVMKWSADFELPAIGTKVFVTMNGIGWAWVKGYFVSEDWVGVMTLATAPPTWLRKQNKEHAKDTSKPQWYRDGIGCEFGCEIRLKRPKATRKEAA
jgi:hypothetical protein